MWIFGLCRSQLCSNCQRTTPEAGAADGVGRRGECFVHHVRRAQLMGMCAGGGRAFMDGGRCG